MTHIEKKRKTNIVITLYSLLSRDREFNMGNFCKLLRTRGGRNF